MRKAFLGALGLALATCALVAPAAFAANEDLKIREVYPSESNESYVVLQAFSANQNNLAGKVLSWNYVNPVEQSTPGSYTIPSNVSNTADQMTILLAAPGYSGPVAPDFVVPGLQLGNRFSRVCLGTTTPCGGSFCIDCVAWGAGGGGPGGLQFRGIPVGKALVRVIGKNCSTLLEGADADPWQFSDFGFETPNPRNNASPIVETPCEPNTGINDATVGEGGTTSEESVRISFSANPSSETTYECKLDSGSFGACVSPVEYSALADETQHKFEVRAIHHGAVEQTPAVLNWTVDTTPSLLSLAEDESSGAGTSVTTGGAPTPAAFPQALAASSAQSGPAQQANTKVKKKHKKKRRAKRARHSH